MDAVTVCEKNIQSVFTMTGTSTVSDIWVLPLQGNRTPVPFSPDAVLDECQGRFSADGHWVAYTSNESGRSEVYVRPFTSPGAPGWLGRRRMGRFWKEGGDTPVWRNDETTGADLPDRPSRER